MGSSFLDDAEPSRSLELGMRMAEVAARLDELSSRGLLADHLVTIEAAVGLDDGSETSRLAAGRYRRVLETAGATERLTAQLIRDWHKATLGEDGGTSAGRYRHGPLAAGQADLGRRRTAGAVPERIDLLIHELVGYANAETDHSFVKAAELLGRFDAIQPFSEANGRMARVVLHWALRRRWPLVWPVSVLWSADPARLDRGLDAWQGGHPEVWVSVLVGDLDRLSRRITDLLDELQALRQSWVAGHGGRAGSLRRHMLEDLIARPIIDARGASSRLGADPSRFSRVARELVAEGVLAESAPGQARRGRPPRRYEALAVRRLIEGWVRSLNRTGVQPATGVVPSHDAEVVPRKAPSEQGRPHPIPGRRPVPSQARRVR